MELKELRASIDAIDSRIIDLFEKRMDVAKNIAVAKKEAGMPIFDAKREEEKLESIADLASSEEYKPYLHDLFKNLFEYSKDIQTKVTENER
ncbi:MAG: chorismate mutase [Lachnospiraceae bacterium]|nr:chorismate mutase [Lachnospiraceae bacterium]MBR4993155.1 chorismate mutase [Lachnospiraceae bacterium]MBR5944720.1 chorismate mutase [Lachnospiraceae bacterium]